MELKKTPFLEVIEVENRVTSSFLMASGLRKKCFWGLRSKFRGSRNKPFQFLDDRWYCFV